MAEAAAADADLTASRTRSKKTGKNIQIHFLGGFPLSLNILEDNTNRSEPFLKHFSIPGNSQSGCLSCNEIESALSKRRAALSGEAAFHRGEAVIHLLHFRYCHCCLRTNQLKHFAVFPLNPYRGNNQAYPYPRARPPFFVHFTRN